MKTLSTPASDHSHALHRIAPFDRVRESELALLCRVLTARTFAPGARIHRGTEPLPRLIVVISGAVNAPAGKPIGPIVGLGSLLADEAVPELVADSRTGAEVLFINRPTFFTLVRECPELLRGFLEIGPAGRRLDAVVDAPGLEPGTPSV